MGEKDYFYDLSRMFIGEVPWSFFIEAFIRILFVYILLVFSMRLMGNRMSALLTRNELVAMVVLAAAIGIPVLSPDRGLIPAILIAIIVVIAQRGFSLFAFRHEKFEKISQGDYATLVKDGVMMFKAMEHSRITRERLISEIRSSGLKHLGNVKRLYFEAAGSFTLVKEPEPKSGLAILPDWDKQFNERQDIDHNVKVCHNCGNRQHNENEKSCDNCGSHTWIPAIKDPE